MLWKIIVSLQFSKPTMFNMWNLHIYNISGLGQNGLPMRFIVVHGLKLGFLDTFMHVDDKLREFTSELF